MIKSQLLTLMIAGAAVVGSGVAQAGDVGTADEATMLLDKAVAHVNSSGSEQAYKDFSTKGNEWQDRDLYVLLF